MCPHLKHKMWESLHVWVPTGVSACAVIAVVILVCTGNTGPYKRT